MSPKDSDLLLSLLRSAVRQWGAFMEIQIAMERAIGVEGDDEIAEYIVDLAPEFVESPGRLTADHVNELLRRIVQSQPLSKFTANESGAS